MTVLRKQTVYNPLAPSSNDLPCDGLVEVNG